MRLILASLILWLSLSAAVLADEAHDPAPRNSAHPDALLMEWNFTQPSKEVSALSDECEKRFPGNAHTCEIVSREKKSGEKPFLRGRGAAATDVILGSDFGRRGKIVCWTGVTRTELKNLKHFPWLTVAQLQTIFESESLAATKPWSCALKKCETESNDCRTLGNAAMLAGRAAAR